MHPAEAAQGAAVDDGSRPRPDQDTQPEQEEAALVDAAVRVQRGLERAVEEAVEREGGAARLLMGEEGEAVGRLLAGMGGGSGQERVMGLLQLLEGELHGTAVRLQAFAARCRTGAEGSAGKGYARGQTGPSWQSALCDMAAVMMGLCKDVQAASGGTSGAGGA